MAMHPSVATSLQRLSDSGLDIADPADDIRGREVQDSAGQKIGKVDDLFIDATERRVRFLEVASGGFLGIGADKLLIPVDAVRTVGRNIVRIDRGRDTLAKAPQYDPRLIDEDALTRTYDYYGYGPYWTPGYTYPQWRF